MIFVDTSAWYATLDKSCPEHGIATRFTRDNFERLVTTDYVLAETLTLLRVRGLNRRAIEFGQRVLTGIETKLLWVEHADVEKAWLLFRYRDTKWSFVDCVSFAVMQRLRINLAFTFDEHFREFGAVTVEPS